MKNWTIEELLDECEAIQRNPYTYDFDRMPQGFCNGHEVSPCKFSLAAVIIDHRVINMGVINDRYPNGHIVHVVNNVEMNAREYLTSILSVKGQSGAEA